jgi:hypothetical protein
MKKKNVMPVFIAMLVLAAVHLIAAVIAVTKLPEVVPVHFDINMVCDKTGSPWFLVPVAVMPLIVAALTTVMLLTGFIKQLKITAIVTVILTLFSGAMFWLMYAVMSDGVQLGEKGDSPIFTTAVPMMLAVLFICIGNYMPVMEPSDKPLNSMGFRVKWTLENPNCWRKTHRFAGRITVAVGLVLLLVYLLALILKWNSAPWMFILLMCGLGVALIVPTVYAYQHRND